MHVGTYFVQTFPYPVFNDAVVILGCNKQFWPVQSTLPDGGRDGLFISVHYSPKDKHIFMTERIQITLSSVDMAKPSV